MAELICPQNRRYQVQQRHGEKLLVVDPADGFRFLLRLNQDRLARGWRFEGDDPKRDRITQRDRARRKVTR